MVWTQAGGDVLYIEATLLPEGSGLTLTGQLGEVIACIFVEHIEDVFAAAIPVLADRLSVTAAT